FDGSKVREVVKVLFPVASIPENTGYVGIFIDGEFVEALSPKLSKDKKYYEYTLDTKAYEDGTHKLEAKLYVDYSNQPRIVDTSSVDITIANKSSIAVPEDGFKLRYKFTPGTERIYRLQQKMILNAISEDDQKKQGSRPFQIQEEGESLKLLYAVDNAYSNGDGLVRMQVVPDKGIKGREFSYVTTSQSDVPKKYTPDNMAPIYMRLTSTGREVFGAIPDYFGLEGNVGTGDRLGLYASFPLPTLPSKGVKPGDSWQTAFQNGALDLGNKVGVKTVVQKITARGELLGVEWEMGHPCAKIRNSIALGTPGIGSNAKAKEGIADSKVSLEETVWFALDTGVVIKFFQDITYEGKVSFGATDGGPSGAPSGVGGGGAPMGAPGGKGGTSAPGGRNADDFSHKARTQGATPPGGRPSGAPQGGPQGGRPGQSGPQGGRPGAGPGGPAGFGGGGNQTAFVKRRMQYLFILEK
ncbi:MAG TPA: hypothetical protein VK171_01220, partial [Fimbriimonas sp.]|nr:hypothetical protein [Fimbriimonas sp.]